MTEFAGSGLPTQKGDGPAFDQVMQAPPVVRLEVRATKQWFETTVQSDRQQIAEAIADRYQGIIQQFINGQRQNYQLSNVALWRKLFSVPGLDMEYTMRAGFETIVLMVYPENQPDNRELRKIVIDIGDVLSAKFGIGPGDPGYGGTTNEAGFFIAWNHPFKGSRKFYYEVHVQKLSFDVPYPLFHIDFGGPPFPTSSKQEDPYTYADSSGFYVNEQYPRSWNSGALFGLSWFASPPDDTSTKKYYDGTRTMIMPTGVYDDTLSEFPRSVYAQPWWTQAGVVVQTSAEPDEIVTNLNTNFGNYVRTDVLSGTLGNGQNTVGSDDTEQVLVIKGNLQYPDCPLSGALDVPNAPAFGVYGYGCWSGVSFDKIADDDVYMIAVDIDAKKIWFGRNGTWANNADPSTGHDETMTLDDPGTGAYYPTMQVPALTFYGVPNVPSTWSWRTTPLHVDSVFSPDLLKYLVPPGFEVSRAVQVEVDLPT